MLDPDTTTQTPADDAAQQGAAPAAAPADGPTDPDGAPASDGASTAKRPARKTAAKRAARKTAAPDAGTDAGPGAGPGAAPDAAPDSANADETEASRPAKKAAARKRPAKKAVAGRTPTKPSDEQPAEPSTEPSTEPSASGEPAGSSAPMVLFQAPETAVPAKKSAKRAAAKKAAPPEPAADPDDAAGEPAGTDPESAPQTTQDAAPVKARKKAQKKAQKKTTKKTTTKAQEKSAQEPEGPVADPDEAEDEAEDGAEDGASHQGRDDGGDDGRDDEREDDRTAEEAPGDSGAEPGEGGNRRRRRRGGRRRRRASDGPDSADDDESEEVQDGDADSGSETAPEDDGDAEETGTGGSAGSRRRRRRRRSGDGDGSSSEDAENTVTRARRQRNPEDEITGVSGSTRLEAKKQRRREGREAGRRRAPIVSEAEFLARRESVERVMVIRQRDDITQIGVLEDKVLVEHYVARESQTSLIGNVYLGRVQNVLPSMEAAFVDIGKGRNAVLYAGEVNWAALGHKDGQPRKIESVLSSGQTVLVQVTKDPAGHKGARLTSQVSLPGRFLVYVPDGNTSGISRKLPDTERTRLKTLLKEIVPDSAGVIVRTAAEGASEEELTRDVERLTARWKDIEEKVGSGKSPQLLYGEPDLTLKVVRDLFTEDFGRLVVEGDDAWDLVDGYVSHVAPDLRERLERFTPASDGPDAGKDVFAAYRLDEQIAKGLDRKVWLPSGGSLVIDRTEAMTVVDVNTGKFTGSGGNLEETVTKNNLEAAEEVVRQLRLRDIGGIIVVDFIDMVLESNRDLVLRRLVECLGRDRTRHQVAEVTSLGLVQMTRKRIGTGLLEAFSTPCEHCKGSGVVLHDHPVESGARQEDDSSRGRRRGGRSRAVAGRQGGQDGGDQGVSKPLSNGGGGAAHHPSPADLAGFRPPEKQVDQDGDPDGDPSGDPSGDPDGTAAPAVGLPGTGADLTAGQNVIGTPNGPAREPVAVPSEAAADASATDDATPAEPAPSPGEPEPPRVVTRRRAARRAAGPPAATVPGSATGLPGTPATPTAEPAAVPVEPQQETEVPDGSADPADGEAGEESGGLSLLHVPVKRKGSRKR